MRFSPLQEEPVCANRQPGHAIVAVLYSGIDLAKGLKLLEKKKKIIPNNK